MPQVPQADSFEPEDIEDEQSEASSSSEDGEDSDAGTVTGTNSKASVVASDAKRGRGGGRGGGRGTPAGKGAVKKRFEKKNGYKYCPGCDKYLALEEFPAGKGLCAKDHNARRNLALASEKQGQKEWFNEVCNDPKKLQEVLRAYQVHG